MRYPVVSVVVLADPRKAPYSVMVAAMVKSAVPPTALVMVAVAVSAVV